MIYLIPIKSQIKSILDIKFHFKSKVYTLRTRFSIPKNINQQTNVNVNIRMYNFDDVQCTVIPSVAYGFVTGMNLQLC